MARRGRAFTCPDCGVTYTSWTLMMDHCRREHERSPAALLANVGRDDTASLDAAEQEIFRLLEIKKRASLDIIRPAGDANDAAAQGSSHQAGDATNAAGQDKPMGAEKYTTAEGKSVEDLVQEDKTVTNAKYPCVDCMRIFTNWQELMDHCRKEHDLNIEALLTNVVGYVNCAALAPGVRRLCEETVRNYEVQIAAEKDRIKQGKVVAKSGVVKCLVCDLECDPKELYDHLLQAHFKLAALDAQGIIPQAGDATDAAAQKISRQVNRRQKDNVHIQGVTEENTKSIDQIVHELGKMKEKPRQSGAQVGKRGAKAQKDAKSSKKPSGAKKYSKKKEDRTSVEGTLVERGGQEEKTEASAQVGEDKTNVEDVEAAEKEEDKTTAEGMSVERGGQEDKTEDSAQVAGDKTNVEEVEAAEKEVDVSYILLKALTKAHRRHIEASSASSDETARSLEKLASHLSFLCAGDGPLVLKIAKAGIDFAITDIHRYQSFLTSAVLTFASVLPRATFSEVFYYLRDQSGNLKVPSIWGPCLRFEEILHQKELMDGKNPFDENSSDEEEDEAETLEAANQIGREGESAAYRYFSSTLRYRNVEWFNELQESRQPFDITLEANDGTIEFVEVKSTDKAWFDLSVKELKFALEKGAAYTVAHVCKSDGGDFNLITYQDIEKHLKSRKLKLVLYPTEDKTKLELNEVAENEDVAYILLKALKKVHRRHLEAASSDETARSLEKLEELASRLSVLCAGLHPLILKIAKAGIDFAFTDIQRYQSFLTSAVLTFASVLPKAAFYQVFYYLRDQTGKANNSKGPSIWGPCLMFTEILEQKELMDGKDPENPFDETSSDEEDDEPEALAAANQIGRAGESAAYRYFSSTLRYRNVKWLNELEESGQPFDITLEASDGTVEYVEVKSTALPGKMWFSLSLNEIKFALEKVAAYSIAYVSISNVGDFSLITYQNIEKHLKSGKLKLVLYPANRKIVGV